jgi:hypothetical protein
MVGSWEDYSEKEHRVVNHALATKIRVIYRESRETYSSYCIRGALIQAVARHRRAPRGPVDVAEGAPGQARHEVVRHCLVESSALRGRGS